METEVQYPVRFKFSNGNLYEIDRRDIELAMERDRTGTPFQATIQILATTPQHSTEASGVDSSYRRRGSVSTTTRKK
jgi:hypothetical protein